MLLHLVSPGKTIFCMKLIFVKLIISVILDLLLNWRIWEGADGDILVMIFHALASLVRDDHPHQVFNLKQFHSVNLINKIFKIYQVCYLFKSTPYE
jgi:hypothetical protein